MPSLELASSVTMLNGIGPAAADKLSKLGIETVYDLISFLPRRYNDWSKIDNISDWMEGAEITFKGVVLTKPQMNPKSRVKPINFFVSDGHSRIKLTFFNSPYLQNKFIVGDDIFVHGKVTLFNGIPNLVNPFVEKESKVSAMNLVRPVYHMTAGLNSNMLQKWIKTALDQTGDQLLDVIPEELSKKYNFCTVKESYYKVHFPDSPEEAEEGRRRLAFEELILLGIGMKLYMNHTEIKEVAQKVIPAGNLNQEIAKRWKQIIANLGFELTDDQKNAIREIQMDLMNDVPMNRLVQGDVGSGKTAVAILSMAMTALMGKQSVLLAPTSVLATQHYNNAVSLLKDAGINVALLLGKTKASLKTEIKEQLKNNEASVIIGTHALLTDDVEFSDLALVIADEQHRFGVKQREKLLIKKDSEDGINAVHNLVMTATPIPRTLAMVLYGDMSTSVIKQKPKGRKGIKTYFVPNKDDDAIYQTMLAKLDKGEQVYIVCPKVSEEEDEIYDDNIFLGGTNDGRLTSVTAMEKVLKDNGIAKKYKTGILYGPMPEKKKLETMEQFLSGEIKILISTTVIEVGVDNPNANLMVIMDADRFGLSTLHQLRGRVGRGDKQSYCVLVSESKSELALSRMKMMCESTDGFELASRDLELRGPGDFFGTRQHGVPSLRAANLFTDLEIAKEACDAVNKVFETNREEAIRINANIEKMFALRFGGKMGAI